MTIKTLLLYVCGSHIIYYPISSDPEHEDDRTKVLISLSRHSIALHSKAYPRVMPGGRVGHGIPWIQPKPYSIGSQNNFPFLVSTCLSSFSSLQSVLLEHFLSAPVLQVKFPSAHYVETIHICTFLQSFYILSHIHRKVDLDNQISSHLFFRKGIQSSYIM